jgi:hypothetical protein
MDGMVTGATVKIASVVGPTDQLCTFALPSGQQLCTVSPTDTLCSVTLTVIRTTTVHLAEGWLDPTKPEDAKCEIDMDYTLTVPAQVQQ